MMHDQRVKAGLPSVLKNLGAMTAIRETYLVEQSLLRTLGPMLGVLDTSFYRLDANGNIIRVLHHSKKSIAEENGSKRVVDSIEEVNNAPISDALNDLFDSVRLLEKSCSRKADNRLLVCYPAYGDSEILGYFVFERDREVTPFEDAVILGVIEVFTNYFNLLDASQRDQLTGLLNRYSLESNLDRLWGLLAAHEGRDHNLSESQPHWIGLLDIDHFKKINDLYGHVIGDEVLIIASRLLRKSLRHTDLVYRYGGEEFVVIVSADNAESALRIFERVRVRVENFPFPQVGRVTLSGGFAKADIKVLPKEVINRADSSLYVAKDTGRNRIFFYDTLIEQGRLKEVSTGSVDLF